MLKLTVASAFVDIFLRVLTSPVFHTLRSTTYEILISNYFVSFKSLSDHWCLFSLQDTFGSFLAYLSLEDIGVFRSIQQIDKKRTPNRVAALLLVCHQITENLFDKLNKILYRNKNSKKRYSWCLTNRVTSDM